MEVGERTQGGREAVTMLGMSEQVGADEIGEE